MHCHKQMYKIGKDIGVQSIYLFNTIEKAFEVATFGYQLYWTEDLKSDAENFAKAAEKFGKVIGDALVTGGKPTYWKEKYENLEKWLLQLDPRSKLS